jgi:succinate-semialdehyde dehydrogenase/glutarate-semialdehyde dehydrogenase
MKFFNLMMERTEELSRLITLENGKPLADATTEHKYSASFLEWFSAEAVRTYGDVIPSTIPGARNLVIKQPVGVVGIITPWNFPSAMITRKIAPALAAGCTCVIKAPSDTPLSALALMEIAEQAGVPAGVLNLVTSKNSRMVAQVLCEHPVIKKISFTGSTGVGKQLMQQSSSTLKKLSFELGGNAPFIVFDDADVDAAVAGAVIAKFRSSGQTCVCANRLYIQAKVYDEFVEKLAAAVRGFKVGNGIEAGITHGPLIHGRAVAKVKEHVEDAVSKGAKVVVGGKAGEGNFYEPTVLANVPVEALVSKDETFGPLAPCYKFETEEEVLKLANDTEFGLAGYFYSRDVGRIWRVSEALEVGMVCANSGILSQATIPFGGVKESGFGKEGSKYGMDDYQITKLVLMGGLGTKY